MSHGLAITTNNINGLQWLTPPNMPSYIIQKRADIINNDRFIVSRFSDQMMGKNQAGVNTASEALTLQQAGNTAIEHTKGTLQESLSQAFEYAVELALANWDTTMLFRITGEKGEEIFDSFNPNSLNNIPLLTESDGDYKKKFKEKHPEAKPEEYQYMQVGNETRKVKFDLKMTVGAGLPNNKAFRYNLILEMKNGKIISTKEARKYLINNLSLDFPTVPETAQEQQETGVYSEEMINQMQMVQNGKSNMQGNIGVDIQGINSNGNVAPSLIERGM